MGKRAHEVPLVEPNPAPLIHCDGVGPMHIENGLVHIVLWAEQITADGDGVDRVVTVRLVAPVDKARVNLLTVTKVLAKLAFGLH